MTHRISAGAIVESDGRVLLVRHQRPGRYDFSHHEAVAEYIVRAAWLAPEEFQGLTVFPPVLTGRYWSDRSAGFAGVVHLPLRRMEFSF